MDFSDEEYEPHRGGNVFYMDAIWHFKRPTSMTRQLTLLTFILAIYLVADRPRPKLKIKDSYKIFTPLTLK